MNSGRQKLSRRKATERRKERKETSRQSCSTSRKKEEMKEAGGGREGRWGKEFGSVSDRGEWAKVLQCGERVKKLEAQLNRAEQSLPVPSTQEGGCSCHVAAHHHHHRHDDTP